MAIKKTVTSTTMAKYAPPNTGVPHPADNPKVDVVGSTKFFGWPNFQYLGGAPQAYSQAGDKALKGVEAGRNQDATGPISDRGRGRG